VGCKAFPTFCRGGGVDRLHTAATHCSMSAPPPAPRAPAVGAPAAPPPPPPSGGGGAVPVKKSWKTTQEVSTSSIAENKEAESIDSWDGSIDGIDGADIPILGEKVPIEESPFGNIKIAVCQYGAMNVVAFTNWIHKFIENEVKMTGRKHDLIIFPENFAVGPTMPIDQNHSFIKAVSEIAKQYGIYFLPGSVFEDRTDGDNVRKISITAPLISDEGKLIGAYRKIHVHAGAKLVAGTDIGLYHTKFGVVGIMICLDIEFPLTLKKILAKHPVLLLNPASIPGTDSVFTMHEKYPSNMKADWRSALRSMAEKYEFLCAEQDVNLVRVDGPFPSHRGVTTVLTPYSTQFVDSFWPSVLTVYINTKEKDVQGSNVYPSKKNNFFRNMKAPDYVRSSVRDNLGSRFNVSRVFINSKAVDEVTFSLSMRCADVSIFSDSLLLIGMQRGVVILWNNVSEDPGIALAAPSDGVEVLDVKFLSSDVFSVLYNSGCVNTYKFSQKSNKFSYELLDTQTVEGVGSPSRLLVSNSGVIVAPLSENRAVLVKAKEQIQILEEGSDFIVPAYSTKDSSCSLIFRDKSAGKYVLVLPRTSESSDEKQGSEKHSLLVDSSETISVAASEGKQVFFQTGEKKDRLYVQNFDSNELTEFLFGEIDETVEQLSKCKCFKQILPLGKDSDAFVTTSENSAVWCLWKLDRPSSTAKLMHWFQNSELAISGLFQGKNSICSFHFPSESATKPNEDHSKSNAIFVYSFAYNRKTVPLVELIPN
jgi:predicted amidohydrolase